MFLSLFLLMAAGIPPRAPLPPEVASCVAKQRVLVDQDQTPNYLKLFFSHSRRPDYVVVVLDPQGHNARVLVCLSGGKRVVLGATGEIQRFSDMPGDNYVSRNWRVCTEKEISDMKRYYSDVPLPVNESICFTWEDGEAIIYWDGTAFRWKSFTP